ncbi:MAG: transglycosylase SLT domain-containing protein [Bdellovibrionales bacterium]
MNRGISRLIILSLSVLVLACQRQQLRSDSPMTASGLRPASKDATGNVDLAEGEINLLNLDIQDVPYEYRYMVVKWLDYYQGRGREHMERYLSRSTKYLPLMKEHLKANGLPEDLVYIPLIESGFSPRARSHASAVGYWQFIRGTGKRYSLRMDHLVDERQDPISSTRAAALYFKGLYNLFGSWYLAIASYNVGENRVQRLVMKHLTRSFWELAHRRVLPRETVDYVPKFIAASMIAREPEKYGFTDIAFMKPLQFDVVETNTTVDMQKLAIVSNIPYEDLKDLNPTYRTHLAVPIDGRVFLRVPSGQKVNAQANLEKAYSKVNARTVAASPGVHRVQRGDNLGRIARMYGTSINAIRSENDLKKGSLLKVGSLLRIPEGEGRKSSKKKKSKEQTSSRVLRSKITLQAKSAKKTERFHKVRPGDTLHEIARRYKVSLPTLVSHNKLVRNKSLLVGHLIKIPTSAIR